MNDEEEGSDDEVCRQREEGRQTRGKGEWFLPHFGEKLDPRGGRRPRRVWILLMGYLLLLLTDPVEGVRENYSGSILRVAAGSREAT